MNPLENRAWQMLLELQERMTGNKRVSRADYMDLMGRLTLVIKSLEARHFGCATGLHLGPCNCRAAVAGESTNTKYVRQYERNK
jgi:hypothetical protein